MKFLKLLLILICLSAIVFSSIRLLDIYFEYKEGEDAYNVIAGHYVVPAQPQPVAPTIHVESTVPLPEADTEPTQPPGETAPIEVDFAALQQECPNVIGWIYCEDSPINYPILQCEDNSYYLKRLPDGTYNSSGSIFMDYRNDPGFSNSNTLIYGHNMNNGSMFGSFHKYRSQAYYDAHSIIYLLTPDKSYKLELFAGYITSVKGDIFSLENSPSELNTIISNAKKLSTFKSNTEVLNTDQLVTLSTCYTDGYRYVLVGVLHQLC